MFIILSLYPLFLLKGKLTKGENKNPMSIVNNLPTGYKNAELHCSRSTTEALALPTNRNMQHEAHPLYSYKIRRGLIVQNYAFV